MTETAKATITCKRLHRHSLSMGALGLDLHPDSKRAFVACMDGVYQLDVDSGKSHKLYAHESYASGVACIHENETLISAGYDGALQWFDLDTGHVIRHIQAHSFWSWDLARAMDMPVVASVTGQYLAGSYEYHPKATQEPCVRVYDAISGSLISSFHHGPPTHSVALTPDGKLVGAGNLMGDAAVWQVGGDQLAAWNTSDFTGFGIIKSHCQIGGIYATAFTHDLQLLVAGMGPMRDPMAGNGKKRWQRFDWSQAHPKKVAESNNDQMGEGLMETMAVHPNGEHFVMAGRLRGGSWNVGLFELTSGDLVHSFKTGSRVTKAVFSVDGSRLLLAGATKQSGDAKKSFGVLDIYEVKQA